MKIIAIWLAAVSLICGLVAAWYWYRASKIPFQPRYSELGDDVSEAEFLGELTTSVMMAVQKTSALNRLAALWTAAAVMLGGAASLIDTLQVH
ncbi:MAG TPA: hypothetical protein VHV56_06480 [Pseudolabrys sp.]|jgi:hypothetical protein|nr:hypothetical protein [Pseudolabrys sp.]